MDPQTVFAASTAKSKLLYSGFTDSSSNVVAVNENGLASRISFLPRFISRPKQISNEKIVAFTYSPNSLSYAYGDEQGRISVLDQKLNIIHDKVQVNQGRIMCLQFSQDFQSLFSASVDGSIIQLSYPGIKCIRSYYGSEGIVLHLAISHDNLCMASISSDNCIRIWSIADGTQVKTFGPFNHPPSVCEFDPTDRFLIIGTIDGIVQSIDLVNGTCVFFEEQHKSSITIISVNPKGQYFVAASSDKRFTLFTMEGRPMITVETHKAAISNFQWNTEGSHFVTCDADGKLITWLFPLVPDTSFTSSKASGDAIISRSLSPRRPEPIREEEESFVDEEEVIEEEEDVFHPFVDEDNQYVLMSEGGIKTTGIGTFPQTCRLDSAIQRIICQADLITRTVQLMHERLDAVEDDVNSLLEMNGMK